MSFRLADPSEGVHRRHALDVRFALALGEQLRVGRPGRDDVDRDAALTDLLGEDARQLLDGRFGRAIALVDRQHEPGCR